MEGKSTAVKEGAAMDTDWLVQLAASGATTLIGAAATDIWKDARAGFARLFGRGDADREALAAKRLDALTAAVEQADASERETIRQQQLPVWQIRLTDLLEEDPGTADMLRGLRDELQARLPTPQQQWVQNNIAHGQGIVFGVQGGNQHVYYGASAGGPAEAADEAGGR
jgi:hypothetical protein